MTDSVLITGGAGFIGSWLVRRLLEALETNLIIYDNFINGHRSIIQDAHPRLTIIEGDIRDHTALSRIMNEYKPTTVFHLAALHFIPFCNSHPRETLDVNVLGTQNILDACRSNPPDRFIFASTAAVYPINGHANSEEIPPDPVDIYGMSKMFGEMLIRRFAFETHVNCTVGRFFNAYGPGETNPHVIPEIIQQLKTGNRLTLGNLVAKRDYIYVDDLAAALESCLHSMDSGYEVYNIGAGTEYSVRELVTTIESILGRPLEIVQNPERMRSVERMHLMADITRIREKLHWKPRMNLTEGLRELLRVSHLS